MTYYPTGDFWYRLSAGEIPELSYTLKFGRNPAVGTTYVPIAIGGVYQTPKFSAATALRWKAGNAADTSDGAGARSITLQGLDETGALATETIATNGASAGSATTTTFSRLFRMWVASSGTYATTTTQSHVGDLTVENAAGGTDWGTIPATDIAAGQSDIGAYSVPLGYRAFVNSVNITVDSNKSADIVFFKRQNIDEENAPFTAMREQFDLRGISSSIQYKPNTLLGPYPALTDLSMMGVVSSGTADISVQFEIILEQTT